MRIVVLLCLLLPYLALAAPAFEILPETEVLEGDPITIRLTGAPAGKSVTISAERTLKSNSEAVKSQVYRSRATYMVAADGTVDLATVAPTSGSYRRADVAGLFWSMTYANAGREQAMTPEVVKLTASLDKQPIATANLRLLPSLARVTVTTVKDFPGAVFAKPSGGGKYPAVIVLGGSEGGASAARDVSPRLASRGLAALGLPYYSPGGPGWPAEFPELPAAFADIPVERLNAAFEWLARREDVDSTRVALYGVSKGAELTLLAASYFGWVSAAVAIVPTDVVWEGWGAGVAEGTRPSFSLYGKPLPFVPYKNFSAEFEGTDRIKMRRPQDAGRAENPGAAVRARIPIENFKGPLLLIAGQDDQVWASGMMAQNIAERRSQAGLETVNLVFADAGHVLSGSGFAPAARYRDGRVEYGGTPEGDARAQRVAFPKTIEFLKRTLRAE